MSTLKDFRSQDTELTIQTAFGLAAVFIVYSFITTTDINLF